jgi:hypothetical protein
MEVITSRLDQTEERISVIEGKDKELLHPYSLKKVSNHDHSVQDL